MRTTTPITVHVDSTAPTVTFSNPGANLAGTVALSATTAGPDAVSVSFEASPAGANTWQDDLDRQRLPVDGELRHAHRR